MSKEGHHTLTMGTGSGRRRLRRRPRPDLARHDDSARQAAPLDDNNAGPLMARRRARTRNPWRFSFDSRTDNLWIGDVGQDHWEEIDFRTGAKLDTLANYGWSRYEGNVIFAPITTTAGQKTFPTLVYSHAHGCSVTGGYVYRGTAVAAAQGRYYYGDYCTGTIWSFPSMRTAAPEAPGSAVTSPHSRPSASTGTKTSTQSPSTEASTTSPDRADAIFWLPQWPRTGTVGGSVLGAAAIPVPEVRGAVRGPHGMPIGWRRSPLRPSRQLCSA